MNRKMQILEPLRFQLSGFYHLIVVYKSKENPENLNKISKLGLGDMAF